MLRSKSTNKTNVIKNAVYDAFLDNCQGLPFFEVNEDDFSLSLVFFTPGRMGESLSR